MNHTTVACGERASPHDEDTQSNITTEVARTPTVAGRQMSASLRERLKRSGRCYSSPVSTPKRSCLVATQNTPTAKHRGKPAFTKPAAHSEESILASNSPPRDAATTSPQQPHVTEDKICTSHDATSATTTTTDNANHGVSSAVLVKLASARSTLLPHSSDCPVIDEVNTDCTSRFAPGDPVVAGGVVGAHEGSTRPTTEGRSCMGPAVEDLHMVRRQLLNDVAKKEERLRKLKMVRMYRAKNDLVELEELTTKWRETSQRALEELVDLSPADPAPTMTQMIQHLGVDPALLHYDEEDESFS